MFPQTLSFKKKKKSFLLKVLPARYLVTAVTGVTQNKELSKGNINMEEVRRALHKMVGHVPSNAPMGLGWLRT